VRRRIRSSVFEASDRLVHGLERVRTSCAAAGRVLPDRYRVCSRRYQTTRSNTFAIDAATGAVLAPMSVVAIVPSAVTNRRFPCRCGAIQAAISRSTVSKSAGDAQERKGISDASATGRGGTARPAAAVLTLNCRLLNIDQDVHFLAAHRSAGRPTGGDQDTPA
jgi:hypothetical protein